MYTHTPQLLDTDGNAEHSFSEFCCLLCVAKVYDEQKSKTGVASKTPIDETESSKAKPKLAKKPNPTATTKTVVAAKPKDKGLIALELELAQATQKSDAQVPRQRTWVNFTCETRIFAFKLHVRVLA